MRLYWKICKPKTYGTRVLIKHPNKPDEILLIRHTYGDQTLWNIPGGGFNPKKESAEEAARREVKEEIAIELDNLILTGEYQTSSEGKRDTVILFCGNIKEPKDFILSEEIAEVSWQNYRETMKRAEVAKVVGTAIKQVYPNQN